MKEWRYYVKLEIDKPLLTQEICALASVPIGHFDVVCNTH